MFDYTVAYNLNQYPTNEVVPWYIKMCLRLGYWPTSWDTRPCMMWPDSPVMLFEEQSTGVEFHATLITTLDGYDHWAWIEELGTFFVIHPTYPRPRDDRANPSG